MAFSAVQLTAAVVIVVLSALFVRRRRSGALAGLPGPEAAHRVLGYLPIFYRTPVGQIDFTFQRVHGGAAKFEGLFGYQHLWLCDPKAVKYVVQGAGYGFMRAPERKENARLILGQSVLVVEGDAHRRQRRIMLPGFGSLEASTYVPSFSRKAAKMADKWVELMQGQDTFTIDVPAWTARATLDALGEAAFDYQFNALDDISGELIKVFNNLFAKTRLNPGNWEIFVSQMVALMPDNLVRFWNENVPDKKRAFLIRSREASERVARQLVEEKSAALLAENGGHDIMSLLVKANAGAGAKNGLSQDEMLAQLSTIVLAGHETTANTISWILLELCRNTDVQTRLRDEIRTVRRQRDEPELTAATFDDMPYMTAIVKEILRFHPAIYNMHKEATRDDIVPLSHPVVGTDGKPIHEIPVQKGQKIILSTAAYNRDTNVFGADAHSFNPDRWLKEGYVTKQSLGVFANLLTFGGGNRACLGWRFAVLELSAFLVELVDKFEFSIDPKLKIQRGAVGFMIPLVEGEIEKGSQLPLQVRLAPSTD